jgi:hypothetical protein
MRPIRDSYVTSDTSAMAVSLTKIVKVKPAISDTLLNEQTSRKIPNVGPGAEVEIALFPRG